MRSALVGIALLAAGCATGGRAAGTLEAPPESLPRGYVIAGGARLPVPVPVVTFLDPGGFDARREACWFDERLLPSDPASGCDTPRRYSRRGPQTDGAPWEAGVDLFVFHYDVAVTSTRCFRVLHDVRGLSVHFLLDLDGTLYQTLDLRERARHAGRVNDRSIGIEIAHPGAYADAADLDRFYTPRGGRLVVAAEPYGPPPGGPFGPRHGRLVAATVNGTRVFQRDFTEAQYRTLARFVPALAAHFESLPLRAPRAADGGVAQDALPDDALDAFSGFVGHHHVTRRKVDPGPAFDWARVLGRPPTP